ncbi:MAG: hypothetical protein J5J00_07155 [Deltaproteobacteria bacterium]|nr:hypothetical protein [Deltaproteobacteria bacterium]
MVQGKEELPDRSTLITNGKVGGTRLIFATLGGAACWLAHLLLSYGIAEMLCVAEILREPVLGLSGIGWMLVMISAALIFTALAALAVSLRLCSAASYAKGTEQGSAILFTARFGALSNLIFVVVIAVESIPIIYWLKEC